MSSLSITDNKVDSTAFLRHLGEGHEDLFLKSLGNEAFRASSEMLEKAAELGCDRLVKVLIEGGAKVENSHLFAACKATNKVTRLKTVQLLINKGADVNTLDKEGYTPLSRIIEQKSFDPVLIKLFIKNRAKIKDDPESPLSIALEKRSIIKVAVLLNISEAQAEEYIKTSPVKRILANVNGVEGTYCWTIHNEGVSFAKKMLDTLPPEVTNLVSSKSLTEMRGGIDVNQDNVGAIQRHRAVILFLGYKGHSVTLIFYDGYMVICNRGTGCKEGRKTFDAFKIDPTEFSNDIFKALINIKLHSDESEFTSYYYDKLPSLLSPVSPPTLLKNKICGWVEELSPGPQKATNCGWANVKDGLFALDALMRFTERNKSADGLKLGDVAGIQKEAKAFAKGFSEHARLSSIDEYLGAGCLDESDDLDDLELFSEAIGKLERRKQKQKRIIPSSRYQFLKGVV